MLVDAQPEARITSSPVSTVNPPGMTLCLGEALVDLICERPIEDLGAADAFVPHFGGAVANVAVVAARHGAAVALAGGAGEDAWGRWLRERLRGEGVDIGLFGLIEGAQTPLAVVAVSAEGEPTYEIYGQAIATVVHALGDHVDGAIRDCAALFISSNTLVGSEERAITTQARERALELGRPVVFDPNFRLHRWAASADAAAAADDCVPGALLVRCNKDEAALMTGEHDPDRAARALVQAGARIVVVTLGPDGAILRGEVSADVPGARARVISSIGAGDVLTGVLLAALASGGFDPSAVAAGLPEAVAASARACERWGALE
jgi:sugar/nucleoside kinase (ribokinase family)